MTITDPAQSEAKSADERDRFFDVSGLKGQVGKLSGKGGAFTLLSSLIKVILLLGTTAILARLIPPSEFGVVALAMPVLVIGSNLSQFGLAQAIVQKQDVTHALASSLFWLNAALGLGVGLCMALLGWPAMGYFDEPRVGLVFPALALSVLLGALSAQYLAIYWRQMRIRELEILNLLAIVVATGSAIIAALLGASYWAIVVQQVVLPLATLTILALRMGWLPSRPRLLPWEKIRQSVKFGGHLAVFNLLYQCAEGLGTILSGRVFTQLEAGLYFRSWNLASMPGAMLLIPLGGGFIPALSRVQDSRAEFEALFARILSRITLIIVPIGVAVCIAAPEIILLMLGPDWIAAAPVFAILGLRILLGPFSNAFRWALLSHGKSWLMSRAAVFHLLLVIGALSFGLQFGLTGLALGYVCAEAFTVFGVFGVLAWRHTALSGQTILGLIGQTLGFVALLVAIDWTILQLLPEMPSLARLACLLAGLGAGTALRILISPALRRDVYLAVVRGLGRS